MSQRADGSKPNNGGVSTRLDEELIKKICDAVLIGCFPTVAALYARVPPQTFGDWIKRGLERPDSIYGQLYEALQFTLGQSEMRDVAALETFIKGRPAEYLRDKDGSLVYDKNGSPIKTRKEIEPDLRALMFKLDRRWQKSWGRIVGPDATNDLFNENTRHEAKNEIDVTPESVKQEKEYIDHVVEQLSKAGYGKIEGRK